MSDASRIADEYAEYRQSTDHLTSLWMGDVEHLEGWEDLSPSGNAAHRDQLATFAERIDRVETTGSGDEALVAAWVASA